MAQGRVVEARSDARRRSDRSDAGSAAAAESAVDARGDVQSTGALMSAGGNTAMVERARGDAAGGGATPAAPAPVSAPAPTRAPARQPGAPEAEVSGAVAKVGGPGTSRSTGDEERVHADGDPPSGSPPAPSPAPAPAPVTDLAVKATVALTTQVVNDLTPSPFGAMTPDYQLTASYTTAGDAVNVSVAFKAIAHWGVAGGGRTDVPSGTDGAVTAANYEDIYRDLVPGTSSPFKSTRTSYWSQALTERHEKYHATDDFKWINAAGLDLAKVFLESSKLKKATIDADLAALMTRVKAKLDRGSLEYYYGGTSDPGHSNRAGEILAYGDGQPHYQALADAVKKQGEALKAKAAPPAPAPGPTG